uniref:Uncharacterized protein n=1 Tax=Siphoviridae sp. ctZF426 TaxID=2827580 RepID=A0A8S5RSG7_9CAUD|nr:MAG TPA: hypothetical protein [Siphoviridae sp. ctZF426]
MTGSPDPGGPVERTRRTEEGWNVSWDATAADEPGRTGWA